MGKEAELLKAVKNNDKSKLQKLFLPEGDFKVQKADSPAGGIRLRLKHINVDCHEPQSGYTPAILAILHGHKEVLESLIFHAADVNNTDSKGNTALHIAVFRDRNDMVEILLRNKARVNITNIDGNTPFHIACQNSSSPNVHLIVKLLEAGAETDLKNKQGHTSLDLAAMFNRKDAVSAMLDHFPDLKQNLSAIVHAATRGHCEIVELLLNYGCDPNGIEPTKQSGPLHEAVRFCRLKVAKVLLEFGARTDLVSGAIQSPEMIAKGLPCQKASEFTSLFSEFVGKTPRLPKYLSDGPQDVALIKTDYPLLPQCAEWNKNIPTYCNSCTASNPNTNLFDGNLCTFWVIPSKHNAWTVFNMGHQHTISGIRVWGWDSPQMVKRLEIQKSENLMGPWCSVATLTCERVGNTNPTEQGVPQDFRSFTDESQFWRLVVLENYGGNCICFQGIQFYGADSRISKLLEDINLGPFTDHIVSKGYNTFEKFILMKPAVLREVIPDEDERKDLMVHMKRLRLLIRPFSHLFWLTPPITMATEGQPLPEFSVQSDPDVTEEVELFVEGSEIRGVTRVTMEPAGPNQASVATFSNIIILNAGSVTLKIQSVRFPYICLICEHTLDIRPKPKSETEVAAAFEDIAAMLEEAKLSLEVPKEDAFSVPDIKWL